MAEAKRHLVSAGVCTPRRRFGASGGTRTRNLLITNQLLCQLSHTGEPAAQFVPKCSWGTLGMNLKGAPESRPKPAGRQVERASYVWACWGQ